MRNIFFSCVILLMACHQPGKSSKFPVPAKDDINAIVKVIVKKNNLAQDGRVLSKDLLKIDIYIPKTGLKLPAPPFTRPHINIKELLDTNNSNPYGLGFFLKTDSAYLLFQNNLIKNFNINSNVISGVRLTDFITTERNRNSGKFDRFFELSIPIFSIDQQKAIVSFSYYCPLCGSGGWLFLKKINGNWQIVKQVFTWQS